MKIETLETLLTEKIKICNNEKMILNKVYQEKEKSNLKFKIMIIEIIYKVKSKILMINKGKKTIIKIKNKMSKKWEIIIKKKLPIIKSRKKKELRNKL